jgi:DNA-binding NarL/FixJ family response regulator
MLGHDPARPIRVLIAEDNPRVRAALRTFLSTHPDFDVIGEAGDAVAALQLARALKPSVALVDVLLPDASDGLGLVRALAGELGIPAVAISISGEVGSSALVAGAYQFLEKDGSPERLIAALCAAAGSRQVNRDG